MKSIIEWKGFVRKSAALSTGICLLAFSVLYHQRAEANVGVENVKSAVMIFLDDIPDWAKSSVEKAVSKGYVDGYPDGTFQSDKQVTRAEFMKMLVNDLGFAKKAPSADEDWYQPYVDALVKLGIHNNHDFDSGYDQILSREEMAKIANRALDKNFQDPKFLLDSGTAFWNMTRYGVIQGLGKGELGMQEGTTRAQAITIIERINAVKNGESLPVDKAAMSYAEYAISGTNAITMWDTPLKKLPTEFEGPNGSKIIIDKFIISDLSDTNSAFYDWYKGFYRRDGVALDTMYAFSFNYIVKIPENDLKYTAFEFPLRFTPDGYPLRPNLDATGDTPLKQGFGMYIHFSDFGDHEGWGNMCLPKEVIDKNIQNGGETILINNQFKRELYYLSEREPQRIN